MEQGGANAHRGCKPGCPVQVGAAHQLLRRAVLVHLGFGRHDAAVSLGHDVAAGALGVRPCLAEARDVGVDQPWVQRGEAGVSDVQPFGDACTVVHQDDVESRDDPVDQGLPVRVREVDRQAALAAIERLEVLALVWDYGSAVTAVFAARRFDFHHIGAHIGERNARKWPGDDLRKLEHADARERTRWRVHQPLGRPRPRVAMTFRWTSLVPPRIVAGTMPRYIRANDSSPSVTCPRSPMTCMQV